MAKKLKKQIYVPRGRGTLALPTDMALLTIALGELRSVGYKGDLYADAELTKSLGNIKDF